MNKSTSSIEQILNELVTVVDRGQPTEILQAHDKALQAINKELSKQVREARIDELKRFIVEQQEAWVQIEDYLELNGRLHTYLDKDYPSCAICGFCPEAMQVFLENRINQLKEQS
ncbi:MAG: hypothetical protein KGI25_03540 [Thaumarchaeota archaeon]|nr:hypothetical protein [Nitrososphaerota archaeon]